MKAGVWIPTIWALVALTFAAEPSEIESESSDDADKTSIKSENGYIFTCPRTLKAGATNELQLRRIGDLAAGHLDVIVFFQNSYTSNESIAVSSHYPIEQGVKNSFLELAIDKFDEYVYNGRVEINGSFGDHKILGSDKVYFSVAKDSIVLIQTDKPLYKKGQTVLFRVLSLNKQLKPNTDVHVDVWVEDPKGTRLFQWMDVILQKGMQQFDFPLADEPALGDWKISVKINDDVTNTNFEVKEYVLPKYEVTIKPPSYVLANAEVIPVTICAKYTYGKPVKGLLYMNISLETYTWSTEKLPFVEVEEEINGCYEYTLNVSHIETGEYYRYRRIQVVASIKETGTGVQRNETQYIQRQFSPLNLDFKSDQRQFYKPGLPYNGKLAVNNPDGTPSVKEGIQICYTVQRERVLSNWWATKKVKVCSNFTSDDEGMIEYIIPPQSTDSVGITVEALSLKYHKNENGNHRQNSLTNPQASLSLTPWFSPSGSFIQLQPVQETLFCGAQRKFRLLFTSKESGHFNFHYQVLNQGNVVQSGVIEQDFSAEDDVSGKFEDEEKLINKKEVQLTPPIESSMAEVEEDCPSAREARYVPPVGEAYIELSIEPKWSPTFYLLVYYVKDNRETIADSQKFKVEECFKNQVKLQFGDAVKQPATKTSIRVSASPNSLCGIKIVDKSVSLLNANDQLTKEKVFQILESFDTGMYYGVNHCNDEVPQPGLYSVGYPDQILPPRPPKPWSSSSYEDSLTAFENAGFLVISDLELFTRPCKSRGGGSNIVFAETAGYGGQAAYPVRQRMALASTARRPKPPAAPSAHSDSMSKSGVDATKSVVEVRNYFPDTWLFSLEMTNEAGEYITKEKLPHTITEWVGSAVCINEEDGLGISNKTSIKGFQAFFMSLTLPYSVIRHEKFEVTLSIFSYVEDSLPIKISLGELDGFEMSDEQFDEEVCVQPGGSTNLKFRLTATALGDKNLTVRAETAQDSKVCGDAPISDAFAKDALERSIVVQAEGWPQEDVKSTLLCPSGEGDSEGEVFDLTLPEDVVPDSGRAHIDATGSILGKSLDNLNNLVTVPTGCGEQNMVKLAPNVVALDVLTATGTLTDKLKSRITKNLVVGTQQQLKYLRPDGSFSAFGTRNKDGSMFLTAFVLRVFSRADKYIPIDNKTVVRMQDWIVSKQQEDGCFPDVGKILNRQIQGGIDKEKGLGALTAYVIASLLISEYQNQTVLDSAFSCIEESQDKSFYATFLYAYAEALADKEMAAKERIAAVQEKTITEGGAKFYQDVNATRSQKIETAAYAVLSTLKAGGTAQDVLPILQFLTKNINSRGGFYSTQDTCVGLEALGEFSKLTMKDPMDLTIGLRTGEVEQELKVDESNKLLVQRSQVPQVPTTVQVVPKGTGCALVQSIVRYNTKSPPEKRSFDMQVHGECLDEKCNTAGITVATSYIPEGQTGMAVVEVKMITGFSPLKTSLDKLMNDKDLQLMRSDVEQNNVVFYFNEISNVPKLLYFQVEKVYDVENAQPGAVKVYDYYNRDFSSTATYSLEACDNATGTCSAKQ